MKDEALRLALEALEEISHVNTYQNEDDEVGMKFCCDQVSYQPHSTDCQTMKAITAIKQALEQPEPDSVPNYCPECLTYNGHQEGCSHHTSPPKRESEPKPVAWMMVNPTHLPNSKSLHWEPQQWHISWEAVPLYTTPPKREPEPVGYLYVTDPWGAPEYHFSVEKKEGYFNEPVYKHPPKRELLTEGKTHCKEKRDNGGVCPRHNLQCGWPECNEAAHGIKE